MNKKTLLIVTTCLAFIIIFLSIWSATRNSGELEAPVAEKFKGGSVEEADVVYFFGRECPKCNEVSDFLEQDNISERVVYAKKEAWHNKGNADEVKTRALECGIEKEDISMPFLYARGKCLMGKDSVIDFFKKEAGI